MIDILGTWGPSCRDFNILRKMFETGMTGIRVNLSHVMLCEIKNEVEIIRSAASASGIVPRILIDMQGPELRIGSFKKELYLIEDDELFFKDSSVFSEKDEKTIPIDKKIISNMLPGQEVLLDDGKIMGRVEEISDVETSESNLDLIPIVRLRVLRGGLLKQRKSISIVGKEVDMPPLTAHDIENLSMAGKLGISSVMQPFVRSPEDLITLRQALDERNGKKIEIYAKIENTRGLKHLKELLPYCDQVVIARGDLGNSMPLWELPSAQKQISSICQKSGKPFMVVTQMLASMEHNKIPTRAEVSDIYNAVLDGASSVMVTGETAVGEYPVEVIRYLKNTAEKAFLDKKVFS